MGYCAAGGDGDEVWCLNWGMGMGKQLAESRELVVRLGAVEDEFEHFIG
jgi:hypothetical protein